VDATSCPMVFGDETHVHLCSKCGVQTIWTPDGPLHENDTTDHLADPDRTLTLEWDPDSSMAQVTSDMEAQKVLHLTVRLRRTKCARRIRSSEALRSCGTSMGLVLSLVADPIQ
jgi:hypothetical protein